MTYLSPNMSIMYRLERMRRMLLAWIIHSTNLLLFTAVTLICGIGSAFYLVDTGTPLTTWRNGPWTMWHHAARLDVDPYTRARYAKLGSLPLSARYAATWEARFDAEGRRLHSSCEYVIESEPIDATWFNIMVFDENGLLIPNAADRYSFYGETIATNPDGSFFIALARNARPGNWLPVGGAGRLTLIMTVIEPNPNIADSINQLPTIRRI
ncbi:MAG: DUF1214 domain-containing protein, partial [Hyphomicrobiaceae bacterium]